MVHMISYWVRASQTLNMDTFVRLWVVLFGLHMCLIVVHLTLEIWRYIKLSNSLDSQMIFSVVTTSHLLFCLKEILRFCEEFQIRKSDDHFATFRT